MEKEKGVTMVSLVIYIVAMSIVIAIMSEIITSFYKNTDTMQGNLQDIVEFNKFNIYFLKEVKISDNRVDHILSDNSYILFTSGNAFSIKNGIIYYNNIKVCENVKSMQISLGKDGNEIDKSIVNVTLNFGSFNKSLSYKLENIY